MSAVAPVSPPALTAGGDAVPACSEYPADMMFPDSEAKSIPGQGRNLYVEDAKAVCAKCPIRLSCLEGALARREPHGIWGGMTTRERENVVRTRYRKLAAQREAGDEELFDNEEALAG